MGKIKRVHVGNSAGNKNLITDSQNFRFQIIAVNNAVHIDVVLFGNRLQRIAFFDFMQNSVQIGDTQIGSRNQAAAVFDVVVADQCIQRNLVVAADSFQRIAGLNRVRRVGEFLEHFDFLFHIAAASDSGIIHLIVFGNKLQRKLFFMRIYINQPFRGKRKDRKRRKKKNSSN